MRRLLGRLRKPPADEAVVPQGLRILMVCMGNICRSPIAEGVLRAKLRQAGLQDRVGVDSAGTHGYHSGEAPDARAIRAASKRGVELAALRARPVVAQDFSRFDWLLAMDDANLAWLQDRRPKGAEPRIALLMEHALRHTGVREVPDPYYGAAEGFERVLDLVEDACDGLVARLVTELSTGASGAPKLD
ncbi:MAG: low molecular weight protein-tyrosine-phosphatase [Rubrivivax sp.]|nr:low molecular weight protein-tyrosine-phosphatase [Rubrivivax sp.]